MWRERTEERIRAARLLRRYRVQTNPGKCYRVVWPGWTVTLLKAEGFAAVRLLSDGRVLMVQKQRGAK